MIQGNWVLTSPGVAVGSGLACMSTIDANGNLTASNCRSPGNNLGITVDTQTNNVVYVGGDCGSAATCTTVTINPITGISSAFAVLPSTPASLIDGIYFDPGGNYLFMANRVRKVPVQGYVRILDTTGTVVNNISVASPPMALRSMQIRPSWSGITTMAR
jgi:hypothetical protein